MPLYHIPRYRNTLMIVTHPFTDGAAGPEHAHRQDDRRERARELHDGGARLAALRVAPDLHQLRPARAQGRQRSRRPTARRSRTARGRTSCTRTRTTTRATSTSTCRRAPTTCKQQINRYRVCACLVAYVLIFIKHIPSCQPNLTYANLLCNKWYEILWTEYNLPRPSKRKKIKLRMMLELFATESAVFEKFMLPESGVDLPDMRPTQTATCRPFASSSWSTSCAACSAASTTRRSSPPGRTASTTRRPPRRTSSR